MVNTLLGSTGFTNEPHVAQVACHPWLLVASEEGKHVMQAA